MARKTIRIMDLIRQAGSYAESYYVTLYDRFSIASNAVLDVVEKYNIIEANMMVDIRYKVYDTARKNVYYKEAGHDYKIEDFDMYLRSSRKTIPVALMIKMASKYALEFYKTTKYEFYYRANAILDTIEKCAYDVENNAYDYNEMESIREKVFKEAELKVRYSRENKGGE